MQICWLALSTYGEIIIIQMDSALAIFFSSDTAQFVIAVSRIHNGLMSCSALCMLLPLIILIMQYRFADLRWTHTVKDSLPTCA